MTTRGLVSVSVGGTSFSVRPRYGGFKVIGRGSYGVVVSATDSETKKKVAIKRIKPMSGHASDAKHALREIRCMKLLGGHANILGVRDLFCDVRENALYIAMELLDSDLHRIIQSPQDLTDAHHRFFMYQLVRGCKYMHERGIIHRDLKPGNLLVTRACELRITDFGLARLQSVCSRGQGGDVDAGPMTQHVVTRWYRPPELMLAPDGRYTNSVDMWSVGCILAELLGRRPLFPGKNFVHQLQLIFDVIGAPSPEKAKAVRNKQARKFLETVKGKPKVPFSKVFPKAHRAAHDVLEKLLAYSSTDRSAAVDLLEHDYFRTLSYADPLPIKEPEAPEADFRFEYKDMAAEDLKQAIIDEVRAYDPSPKRSSTTSSQRDGDARRSGSSKLYSKGASDEARRAVERQRRREEKPPRRDSRRDAYAEARREVEASAQRAREAEAKAREEARRAERELEREREARAREREIRAREEANAREREAQQRREARARVEAARDAAPRRRRDDPISRAFREAAAELPKRRSDPLSQRMREHENKRYAPPAPAPAYVYQEPTPPPPERSELPRRPPAPLPCEHRERPAPPQRAPPRPPSPDPPARTFANQISRDAGRAPDLPPRVTHGRLRRSDDSGGPSYLRDTARSKAYTKASRAYAPLRRGTHANRKKRQPTVPKSPAFSKFSWQKPRARENAY
jgi:serine/threonine protein kinase